MLNNNLSFETYSSILDEYINYYEDRSKKLDEIEKAEKSLHEFHKQAWDILETDPFVEGWYLGVLCEHVEALFNREIKNLIVNLPPRMGKSTLISVTAPVWRFIHNPAERFVYASHSTKLAHDLSIRCRRLILSEWFQARWGHLFKLVGDQNTKGRFDNDKTGYRIATTVGSLFTGGGGTALFCVPYDTEIITIEGRKWIGEIYYDHLYTNKNHKVLSFNHDSDLPEYKDITKYERSMEKKEIIEIELDDRILECTFDHPIYIKDYGYVEARHIQPGHVLLCI